MPVDLKPLCVAMLVAGLGAAARAQSPEEGRRAIGLELFPRLVAMDAQLDDKRSADGSLTVTLVRGSAMGDADRHAERLRQRAPSIRGTRVTVQVSSVTELANAVSAPSAIFILDSLPAGDRERVLSYARRYRRIVFSPFEGDVERGVPTGISISARVMLYFNARAVAAFGLELDPAVMKLSRVYE